MKKTLAKIANTSAVGTGHVLRLASVPAGIAAVGSEGSPAEMAVKGYAGLAKFPGHVKNMTSNLGAIHQDYNSLTANAFTFKYGGGAMDHVISSLNGTVGFINQAYENASDRPIETLSAVAIATVGGWALGRGLKFFGQKGQGGYITRMERNLGNKIWRRKTSKK